MLIFHTFSCVTKPKNSTCTNYNNTHFNYTGNTEFLLQLEYEAMNYIERNVTNQYCRNYLKAALCVTIYPPCYSDGVQKLCSETCDMVLNSGACSTDTISLNEFVSSIVSNSDMYFSVSCSNSLSFSSRFTSTLPCQSSKCISLIEIAETPAT